MNNERMTTERIAELEAAHAVAEANVANLKAELKKAEHIARYAYESAHYAKDMLNYETRLSAFESAARAAMSEAKVKAGMSAEHPNDKLAATIRFDVPFKSWRGDAVLRIQPLDYSKRERLYKQKDDGSFNVKAIAALFAEAKPYLAD